MLEWVQIWSVGDESVIEKTQFINVLLILVIQL